MIHTSYDPLTGLEAPEEPAGPSAVPGQATRERILDAAERLFAEHGFAGTSHRQITAEARVNLAAVNYHFGSKEALFLEVVRRRLEPVNRRRVEMLDEAERRGGAARLEDVARAFVEPVVAARMEGGKLGVLPKLMARVVGEPGGWAERLLPVVFAGVAARFLATLERAMPEVKREDLLWGLVFSAGVLSHYLLLGDLIRRAAGGAPEAEGAGGETVERMVRYIAAGLKALRGAGGGGAAKPTRTGKSGRGRKKA
jgi:AcrR family transcriptional regulator